MTRGFLRDGKTEGIENDDNTLTASRRYPVATTALADRSRRRRKEEKGGDASGGCDGTGVGIGLGLIGGAGSGRVVVLRWKSSREDIHSISTIKRSGI
ncbi:hypothetical protein HZH68_002118 [Vespula germanica]|uniref:Uncharacterized protein n=2 Tax=Vespula TaxID=7451 RepID=A0A834NM15_VESGE|nr:hypothetical protein HZH66_001778 [Vespula vulgaris]KAF7413629.1 hypothetical protein HZH68_002118 [Vespula germanica]